MVGVKAHRAFVRARPTRHDARPLQFRRLPSIATRAASAGDQNRGGAVSVDDMLMGTGLSGSTPLSKVPEVLSCELYRFTDMDSKVIGGLKDAMHKTEVACAAVAGTNIALSLWTAMHMGEGEGSAIELIHGVTIGDVAYWADSIMLLVLIRFASLSFDDVLNGNRGRQMARTFQGVNRLGLIFQQLSIGSLAVTTVTMLEASAKYPQIVGIVSVGFFFFAVVRGLTMAWVLNQHAGCSTDAERTLGVLRGDGDGDDMPLLDRWATWLAFGYLVQFEDNHRPDAAAMQSCCDTNRAYYEFTNQEERILKRMLESAQTAGLAISLQALATFTLAAADFGSGAYSEMVSDGINMTNKAIMAWVLFESCATFDRALHTRGVDDARHLMEGLGEHGLTETFNKLAVLGYAISIAAVVGLAVPWIEESPLATGAAELGLHGSVELAMEALKKAAQMARGI